MKQIKTPHILTDDFQRTIRYLRISVTDRCDFRCVYCMSENMQFLPRDNILSLEEIHFIARAFTELGVEKIRLTGGEPLVRKGIVDLAENLAQLEGLQELTMTSNGSQLSRYAMDLAAAGVARLNISLDTLDPKRFKQLTRTGRLEQVLAGIQAAKKAGFSKIKLNAVILKHRNHDEVCDLVAFAIAEGLDISFIEEMPLGEIGEHDRAEAHYASHEILWDLRQRYALEASSEQTGGPSRYYRMANCDTRVGFISPHSNHFCDTCNRVRLTAEGVLLLCLGQENSVDLRVIVRQNPDDLEGLKHSIIEAMHLKPKKHEFSLQAMPLIQRHMNMTGG